MTKAQVASIVAIIGAFSALLVAAITALKPAICIAAALH